MSKYIALTIGPIGRTLSMARKTRELWAASYLFDWLSRSIAREMLNRFGEDIEFVKPRLNANQREHIAAGRPLVTDGIGHFPDQLIIKGSGSISSAEIREVIDGILRTCAEGIQKVFRNSTIAVEEIEEYLRDYLQIYFVVLDSENLSIPQINRLLGTLELQRNFSREHRPFLEALLTNVRRSWLANEAFGKNGFRIPSLPQIALADILDRESDTVGSFDDEDDGSQLMELAYRRAEKNELAFHQAYRYVAMVKFDGDNLGKLLAKGEHVAEQISSGLVNFSTAAAELIRSFGGFPVFIGGDDALFFAPVVYEKDGEKRNVFDLLVALDETFSNVFEETDLPEESSRPTLSFGVSISYYKYPMYEALKAADDLLFGKAKTGQKHKIAFRILKHSGSDFEAVLPIGSELFEHYRNLLDEVFRQPDLPVHSVVYKIREAKAIFDQIGNDEEALIAFLSNSFNEAVHQDKKAFFEEGLVPIVRAAYGHYPGNEANERLFDLLKSILFLAKTEKAPEYE